MIRDKGTRLRAAILVQARSMHVCDVYARPLDAFHAAFDVSEQMRDEIV
jgi:hypothetical protein